MHNNNLQDWLIEQDIPAAGGQPDPMGAGAAGGAFGGGAPGGGEQPDPNITNLPQQQDMGGSSPGGMPDVTQDPQTPDMPEQTGEVDDFEVWKNNFMKESIKGDTNLSMELLQQVRPKLSLKPNNIDQAYQNKFVEDNWQIQLVRQNSNIDQASKSIRKLLKDQLDRNNPGTSVINHIAMTLDQDPMLNTRFITLSGYGSLKSDLHRKFMAALLGAFQVGGGGDNEDIVFNQPDYSIMISTRFNARWGDVSLGNWTLREDDPERYLSEPEQRRLQEGSPEEKEVLRHRIVMESIAHQFENRAFLIHVTGSDGTVYGFGWDLANSIRAAYTEGKLVVKTRHSENSEAMIDDDGRIIPLIDLDVKFVKETGGQSEDGTPETEFIEFMERRNGMLFLSAGMQTIREAASILQGASFKETPWKGNPSDLLALKRCVYSAHDLIMRQC